MISSVITIIITKVSINSETVTNEAENIELDREHPNKDIYLQKKETKLLMI